MLNNYPFGADPAEYKRIMQDAERLRQGVRHQQSLSMLRALARQI